MHRSVTIPRIGIIISLVITSGFCWLTIPGCTHAPHTNPNKLMNASSPYLRQHAYNPVNWYPWNEEALEIARKENKPLLISIGYSACHWCQVMEKESFMDTAVARLMNEYFICIKVDREERPDIDNIYLHACQLLNNGDAGWPLNAFALPNGKPFFAGTYYSKESWIKLLTRVAYNYANNNSKVVLQANSLTYGMADNDSIWLSSQNNAAVTVPIYQSLYKNAYLEIDLQNGGLKGKQKFPVPSLWEFFLQYHYYTGNKEALDATVTTLTGMALGGIYDHVGGGFARYSTDSLWRVPHFEKMLYDNAQLISLYTHAWQVTQNEYFKKVATHTIDFIERELTPGTGGVYSSLSAGTYNSEGNYYTWKAKDIEHIAGTKEYNLLARYYSISAGGNWQNGKNILYATQAPASFALANGIDASAFDELLHACNGKLLAERNKRPKPAIDDKIITSWNALLIKAYADAYMAFGNEAYLKRALTVASFIEKNMFRGNGGLWRSFCNGNASINAFLDDYAFLAQAFTRLYEVTFDIHWLSLSEKLARYAIAMFYNPATGLFYYTPNGDNRLVMRKTNVLDNVLPSSNAVMGEVLHVLGALYQNGQYTKMSELMASKMATKLTTATTASPAWALLAGKIAHNNYEVAIMGKAALPQNRQLQTKYLPACMFMGGTEENLPLLQNKLSPNSTLIYVCYNKVCRLPVNTVSAALQQINRKSNVIESNTIQRK